jgi:hypothetical protein
VIQCRFYDLMAFIATPFSDAGKSRAAAETPDKKAWLTLSGYQSLSEIEPKPDAQPEVVAGPAANREQGGWNAFWKHER